MLYASECPSHFILKVHTKLWTRDGSAREKEVRVLEITVFGIKALSRALLRGGVV